MSHLPSESHLESAVLSVEIESPEDLTSYFATWRQICTDGITYHDRRTFSASLSSPPTADEAAKYKAHQVRSNNADQELLSRERDVIAALNAASPEDCKAYLALQGNLAELLLCGPASVASVKSFLVSLEAIANKHPSVAAAQARKQALLTAGMIDASGAPLVQHFRRSCLFQKQAMLGYLDTRLKITPESVEQTSSKAFRLLATLLPKHGDLRYDEVDDALPLAPSPRAVTFATNEAPESDAGPDYAAEYKSLAKELATLDTKLKDNALALRSSDSEAVKEKCYQAARDLTSQRESLSYVMEHQRKKMGLIDKAQLSAKDFFARNMSDKSAVGKATAKVFFATAGITLGKAVWNGLRGQKEKNDLNAIKKELLLGVAETGLTALGTYFLGPLGGKFAGEIIGFFREKPEDPYLKEFGELKKQIDEGFAAVEGRLEALKDQISTELKGVVKHLVVNSELQRRMAAFDTHRDHFIANLKKLNAIHGDVTLKRVTTIDCTSLVALDKELSQGLVQMVSVFFHGEYQIGGLTFDRCSKDSLCQMILQLNRTAGVAFDQVCGDVLRLCAELVQLARRYLELREKWFATLAAALVFFEEDRVTGKDTLLSTLWDAHRLQGDLDSSLLFEMNLLEQLAVGPNNAALSRKIALARENPARFDFLCGFSLGVPLTPDENAAAVSRAPSVAPEPQAQYEYVFADSQWTGKGTFRVQGTRGQALRYYISDFVEESVTSTWYRGYTNQAHEVPLPLKLFLRVGEGDTLEVENVYDHARFTARAIMPEHSVTWYGNSLERLALTPNPWLLTGPTDQDISLPVPSLQGKVSCHENHSEKGAFIGRIKIYGGHVPSPGTAVPLLCLQCPVALTEPPAGDEPPRDHYLLTVHSEAGRITAKFAIWSQSYRKRGSGSIVLWDAASIKPQDVLSSAIPGVIATSLELPLQEGRDYGHTPGVVTKRRVRTENLRPFASNLLLTGAELTCAVGEEGGFGKITESFAGVNSLGGDMSLAFELSLGWDTRMVVQQGGKTLGSVFQRYSYANNFMARVAMQPDGNLVMYDGAGRSVAATDSSTSNAWGCLLRDGTLRLIKPDQKELKQVRPTASPEMKYDNVSYRTFKINRLLPGTMLRPEHSIESSNGLHKVILVDIVHEKGWLSSNEHEFALVLRSTGRTDRVLLTHAPTSNTLRSQYVTMQEDGNLVIYRQKSTTTKFGTAVTRDALAATGTEGHSGLCLCVDNSGRVFLAWPEKRQIHKWLNAG